MKLFKDLTLLTGRSEPRVPPEVYKAVSDTIQACQLGGADPTQAAEKDTSESKASSPDTREHHCSDESLSTFVLNPEISASDTTLVIWRKYPEPIDASNGCSVLIAWMTGLDYLSRTSDA